ncbi:MAG: hypothetical protein MUO50_04240 [Longimicrobiales bacterium]|nr:hypothetical protein [Longimicrobiales bacterium]
MDCPDINCLIDLVGEVHTNPELEAHLLVCPSCRDDLRLFRELAAALRPDLEVPDRLVPRVMAAVDVPEPPPEKHRIPVVQVLGSGVLGWLTALGVIIVTGSVGAGEPIDLFLFSALVGITASVVEMRGERGPVFGKP